MKTIYELNLHETIVLGSPSEAFHTHVKRVAGGWVYIFFENEASEYGSGWKIVSTQFVPYNNEFNF